MTPANIQFISNRGNRMTAIAEQLMTAGPPVSALRGEPFSITEMDAHPDSGRIWATIQAMKAYTDQESKDAYNEGYDKGCGVDDTKHILRVRCRSLVEKYDQQLPDEMKSDILALTDGL